MVLFVKRNPWLWSLPC